MKDRVPYAERDATILAHCTCHYVWSERDGKITRHELVWRDPKCKLHGSNAERTPY